MQEASKVLTQAVLLALLGSGTYAAAPGPLSRLAAKARPIQASAPPQSFTPPPRFGLTTTAPLSLQQVLAAVLLKNHLIAASRDALEAARYNLISAKGAYEPRLTVPLSDQREVTPFASLLGGGPNGEVTQTAAQVNPEISGLIPGTGGSYSLKFSTARETSNSEFVQLNPQYVTSISLSAVQPLWRGLHFDQTRLRIALARSERDTADAQHRQQLLATVTAVREAYWNLAYARRALRIQEHAANLGLRQWQSEYRQEQRGLLAPADLTQNRRQYDVYVSGVFAAQQQLTQAENVVKQLMLSQDSDPLWGAKLQPTTALPVAAQVPTGGELPRLISTALRQRPEIELAASSLASTAAQVRYSREQVKPQLDFSATLGASGLSGSVVPPGPNPFTSSFEPIISRIDQLSVLAGLQPLPASDFSGSFGGIPQQFVGGWGRSFHSLGTFDYPLAAAGLTLSLPLRNRAEEAALSSALLQRMRAREQQGQSRLQVVADVRNAAQQLATAQQRLHVASDALRQAEIQYDSEVRQFRAGLSTTFLVLQRQTDLINTRDQEALAQANLGIAEAEMQRALGDLR